MTGEDSRIETILREYLQAQDAGLSPDAQEFLSRFPGYSTELTAFFEATKQIESSVRWLTSGRSVELPQGIEGFQVSEEIGRGGMGVVYKAFQPVLGRTVALKLLRADDATTAVRLVAEARAAARLDHPGIVPIFEVGEHARRPFLAMAFVPGKNLAASISRGPLSPKEAARIVRSVANAVQHAHEQGIIHRDLKPANILLAPDGQPRVTDFGLAKRSGEETLTSDGQILGTPAYMPPEFAAGDALSAGPTADVYGLGAVLYALLTGRPPFSGDTPLDTIRQVAQDEPVPPRERNPSIDRGIQAICLKCLEKNPRHRYPSASAVAADLDRYLRGEPPKAEQLGWAEWARRQLDLAVDFGHASHWARLLRYLAGVSIVAHTIFFFAAREANRGWVFWVYFLLVNLVTTWGPCGWAAARRRLDPRERELLLFWFGVSIGQVILFADRCPVIGTVAVTDVFHFFPSSLVLYGVMFFAGGRLYWGRFYLFGLADFAAAIVLLYLNDFAPLLYGLWQGVIYAAISRHLGRVAREWSARAPSLSPARVKLPIRTTAPDRGGRGAGGIGCN